MKARLLVVLAIASCVATACGEPTPCDNSLDKVESCGVEGFELTEAGEDCDSAFAICQAGCINKGSCNDIRAVVQNPGVDNALNQCFAACGE
jgi:hypothetical protein